MTVRGVLMKLNRRLHGIPDAPPVVLPVPVRPKAAPAPQASVSPHPPAAAPAPPSPPVRGDGLVPPLNAPGRGPAAAPLPAAGQE